jgi:hypothetical protein
MEVDYEAHCEVRGDDDWKIELRNIVNFIIVTQATPKNSRREGKKLKSPDGTSH